MGGGGEGLGDMERGGREGGRWGVETRKEEGGRREGDGGWRQGKRGRFYTLQIFPYHIRSHCVNGKQ